MEVYVYEGKKEEEVLTKALTDLNVTENDILLKKEKNKGGLFKSETYKLTIVKITDIQEEIKTFLKDLLNKMDIDVTFESNIREKQITIKMFSDNNAILIGKNGKTLLALSELTKLAVCNHFHKRFRVLLDVNGYKDNKYDRLARIARKCAHEVQRTKATYTFDPMPADERRAIHNACSGMPNVRTESIEAGTRRRVQIIYVD